MFNKENVDFLSVLHKQDENYTEIIKQFGQMGKTISEMKDAYTKSTSEIVILQPFEQTFAANGYRCNSIFVSDAAAADNVKLIVSLNAVTWTTNLAAGENVVNIPNQATFKATTTSGFAPSVILTRYNVPGIDNNVTVTNTPSVSLIGRSVTEFNPHNAVAITDTNVHDSIYYDVSAFGGRKLIIVSNSLNQSVNVQILVQTKTGVFAGSAAKAITTPGIIFITASDIPQLLDPMQKICVRAYCGTAPTSGSISTFLEVNPV